MTRLSFPVGRQRLSATTRPSEAGYTRQIRAQMDEIIQNYKKVIQAIEATSRPGLMYALQPIFDESQILVPVDTGDLRASGYIEVKRFRGKVSGEVGYAKGGQPHYAAFVHEMIDIPHAPPTQSKFLEEAVNRHIQKIVPRYAEFIRGDLGL